MKIELPCAIVRDLLPSYVEGLTETETTTAVKDHIEACTDCRKRYASMTEAPAIPDNDREVDYLKTVRKKNKKMILLSVTLAVALVLTGVCTKLFWIGWTCNYSSVVVTASASENQAELHLNLREINPGFTLLGFKTETREGVTRITARQVLTPPFHQSGSHSFSLPLENIQRVDVFGRTVWQDDLIIDLHTNRLLDHKTPYVGDAPAVSRLISNMDLDVSGTLELQTVQEPYGVTIHFTDVIQENRRFVPEGYAYVLLALVENLGEVHWDDPSGYSGTLTLDEANHTLPGLVDAYNRAHGTELLPLDSVKDYGANGHDLQLLRNLLGI